MLLHEPFFFFQFKFLRDRQKLRQETWLPYLFTVPILVWMAFLIYYPILNGFYFSFTDQTSIGGFAKWVGLDTYRIVFSHPDYLSSLRVSVLWTVGCILVGMPVGLIGALVLNEKVRGTNLARSLVLLPWMIPTVVTATIFHFMLSAELGVVNYYLLMLGIVDKPLVLLGSPQNALPTTILVATWRFAPFGMVLNGAAMATIPPELYEAASIDGASAFQKFRHITMPSLYPVLGALGLLGTIWQFNSFDFPYLLTMGGPGLTTTTMPVMMYRLVIDYIFASRAYALSMIMFVVLLLFGVVYLRRVKAAGGLGGGE